MSDPDRLVDRATGLEARLLASALDEAPPPELLARTLQAVGVAGAAATAATSGAATSAGAAAAAKAAGAGILGAVGIGAVAGALVVGAFELATRGHDLAAAPAASTAPSAQTASAGARSRPPARVPEPSALPVTTAAPPPEGPVRGAPSAAPAASSPHPSTLAVELELLDEARSALRGGDPARARTLLDRYTRELPGGQMAREAALLRADVEAAIDAGRANP